MRNASIALVFAFIAVGIGIFAACSLYFGWAMIIAGTLATGICGICAVVDGEDRPDGILSLTLGFGMMTALAGAGISMLPPTPEVIEDTTPSRLLPHNAVFTSKAEIIGGESYYHVTMSVGEWMAETTSRHYGVETLREELIELYWDTERSPDSEITEPDPEASKPEAPEVDEAQEEVQDTEEAFKHE